MISTLHRRRFLTGVLSSLAATRIAAGEERHKQPICAFTKPFNSLSFDQLADQMQSLGFDGIEAPIRKGGHIEPSDVEQQLPGLVEALKTRGLEITVLTSDINDPDDPLTERVLRTAAKLGIRRYRMKYFRYDEQKPIAAQLAEWRAQVRDLAAVNRELGIQGLYQNHAGDGHLGAVLWDLQRVLDGTSSSEVGVAFDIRHATVEAGMSWPTTFRMIRPHVEVIYVKDFVWNGSRPKNVPLGEGRVDPGFFRMLAKSNFQGPISLHEEYLDHKKPELVPRHLAAMQRDLATLRSWL